MEVESGVEDGTDGSQECILVPDESTSSQANAEDIHVLEQENNHSHRIEAVPDHLALCRKVLALELVTRLIGNCFWEEEKNQHSGKSVQRCQKPEDDPPGAESSDNTLKFEVSNRVECIRILHE